VTSILTRDYLNLAQQSYGPMSNVFEISDWGCNKVEGSGHAAILSSRLRHAKASSHSFSGTRLSIHDWLNCL